MSDKLILILFDAVVLLVAAVAISPLLFAAAWVHRWINREK
jgi:hypothetical protein